MRGERLNGDGRLADSTGSSPHARGTRFARFPAQHIMRFVPACAGNASAVSGQDCGPVGPSPHARGTLTNQLREDLTRRFIPACAGNAKRNSMRSGASAVHPRMRGERLPPPLPTGCPAGSSPHTRGTPDADRMDAAARRFIPACAGNARNRGNNWHRWPVHPRMRGERGERPAASMCSGGSSPHARGTR